MGAYVNSQRSKTMTTHQATQDGLAARQRPSAGAYNEGDAGEAGEQRPANCVRAREAVEGARGLLGALQRGCVLALSLCAHAQLPHRGNIGR